MSPKWQESEASERALYKVTEVSFFCDFCECLLSLFWPLKKGALRLTLM